MRPGPRTPSPSRPDAGVSATGTRADARPAPVDAAPADSAVEVGLADAAADALLDTAAAPEVAVDTAPPSVIPPPPAPCMATVALPAPSRRLPNGPRGDDFTFAPSGHLVGFDGRNLVRWARPGRLELVASNVIGMRGGALRALVSGELLIADFERDAVSVLEPGGQLRRSGNVDEPMKMALGPGGAYVTSQDGRITRIDANGAATPVGAANFDVGGLTFIDEYRTLVVGGLSVDGLHAFDVRADGTLAPPRLWRGQIARAQALATDACNNVYVISEQDSRIRRIGPGMTLTTVADLRATNLWALAFGSGQQGWSRTALYVEEANTGGVYEVELGVGGQAPPP